MIKLRLIPKKLKGRLNKKGNLIQKKKKERRKKKERKGILILLKSNTTQLYHQTPKDSQSPLSLSLSLSFSIWFPYRPFLSLSLNNFQ